MASQAISVQIADAVAAQLRSTTLTLSPDIFRDYVGDVIMQELDTLRVDVQPGDQNADAASRAGVRRTCRIDILVRKHFSPAESESASGDIKTEEIDRLLLFMEEIHDVFFHERLESYEAAAYVSVDFRPLYFPGHLRQHRQFTGIVAITFEVVK